MRTAILASVITAVLIALPAAPAAAAQSSAPAPGSTADHTKFEALQRDFRSGPEVTRACLGCHTEAAKQVHRTQHWNWEYVNPDTGQVLGKKHVINNFCTSVASNLASCATCHVGYGWKDDKFDFAAEDRVDCLVCHDRTGRYRKQSGLAGDVLTTDTEMPVGSGRIVKGVDLQAVARRVGRTSRDTCGTCHFRGGGGDGVKHGDLDSSLESPDRALDVHMARNGNNFTCATCHRTEGHQVPGSRYAPTAQDRKDAHMRGKRDPVNPATCQTCHGQSPHRAAAEVLDGHTRKIACQTCHIPYYARGGIPTKMSWDWSTAGRRGPDGKPLVRKNDEGYEVYNGTKGDFMLAENVVPEYMWFNGKVKYTLLGDRVEKSGEPVRINGFEGSATDGKSLIWPVKRFRGKQPYDPVNKTIVVTHLAGNDGTAYWTNLDWRKAVAAGMAAVNAPFSGEVDFIETESVWPMNHMVAPKEQALKCADCHVAGGRLAKVPGISIPIFGGKQ